jgi:hypothetical protein
MSKFIVANGCSFTEEYYLEKQDRWTTKCEVDVNLALGGGSNERILYTTLEYLNHTTPDILIVGWTHPQRFMLPKSNGSRIVITPTHTFDENLGGDERKFSDFYYRHCENQFTSLERTLNYMIHLQIFCKHREIKLLYFNGCLPNINDEYLKTVATDAFMSKEDEDIERMGIQHNLTKIKELIERLDKDIWINAFWYSMGYHCRGFPTEKGGHPDVEGSNHWSKLVKQYL